MEAWHYTSLLRLVRDKMMALGGNPASSHGPGEGRFADDDPRAFLEALEELETFLAERSTRPDELPDGLVALDSADVRSLSELGRSRYLLRLLIKLARADQPGLGSRARARLSGSPLTSATPVSFMRQRGA